MRTAAALALAGLLAGCATPSVSLYADRESGGTGAVAVLDRDSGAEVGALTQANTETRLDGKAVRPRPARGHAELLNGLPPPPQVFVLYFLEGSTNLTPQSAPVLAALRQAVGETSDVQVTGHTDTVGSADDNDRLSRQRAAEIRSALVAEGLPVGNARVTGRGEREPKVKTPDGVDEPQNRRVEVILR